MSASRIILGIIFSIISSAALANPSTPLLENPPSLQDVLTQTAHVVDVKKAKLATVLVFLSAQCPCSASHEPALSELHKKFSSSGFEFFAIHSNVTESAELTEQHFKKVQLPFKVLKDSDQKLADILGALKTPHVFVIDPKGQILYQGGVDESRVQALAQKHYLQEALQAIVDKKEISNKSTRTLGCVIARNK